MLLILITTSAFILSFALACGLGANDVSNAFATSIGAKIISLRNAFIIASVAEMLGSIALGGLVTEKIIRATLIPGILTPWETVMAMEASLLSVALWLGLATFLKLPVSATHAVISAMIGAGMMANPSAVCWSQLSHMALAWVTAPVLSGILSSVVYKLLDKLILTHSSSVKRGLFAIPFIYSITIGVNVAMIGYQLIYKLSLSLAFIIVVVSIIASVTLATLVLSRIFLVPWTRMEIEKGRRLHSPCSHHPKGCSVSELESVPDGNASSNSNSPTSQAGDAIMSDKTAALFYTTHDNKTPTSHGARDVEKIFSILQVLSAIFTSFAHGSNDVSNSIGPLFGLINAHRLTLGLPLLTSDSLALYGLLAFGGVGMTVGLFAWGARVIETLGTRLTASISPSKGFSIELGSALTVLGASIAGLSVSTTHCKVGAIVAIGLTNGQDSGLSKEDDLMPVKLGHALPVDQKSNSRQGSVLSLLEDEKQAVKKLNQQANEVTNIKSYLSSEESIDRPNYRCEIECKEEITEPCSKVSKNNPTTSGIPVSVNWKLIGDIFASWICTIPFAGLLSAGFYFCFSRISFVFELY